MVFKIGEAPSSDYFANCIEPGLDESSTHALESVKEISVCAARLEGRKCERRTGPTCYIVQRCYITLVYASELVYQDYFLLKSISYVGLLHP